MKFLVCFPLILFFLIGNPGVRCIFAQQVSGEDTILKEVFPQAAKFIPVRSKEVILYYKAYSQGGRLLGAVFKAAQKGYSGEIETLAGVEKDGTITAIKVLSNNETPGSGSRVSEPAFTDQFKRRGIGSLDTVEAVTGATISSKAVVDSVKKKAEEIIVLIKDQK